MIPAGPPPEMAQVVVSVRVIAILLWLRRLIHHLMKYNLVPAPVSREWCEPAGRSGV
ncbi:hypothetical protein GCM10022205_52830 [Spinactinospora alkalitolerans]